MTAKDGPFDSASESQDPPNSSLEQGPSVADYNANRAMEMQASYVISGLLGIGIAGSTYPFFFAVFGSMIGSPRIGLIEALLVIGFVSLVGSAIGFAFGLITGLIAVFLVNAINFSLGHPLDPRSATICAGSLAGYIPTSWIMFSAHFGSNFLESIEVVLLGPVLAMVLGACGAAWSSSNYSAVEPNKLKLERKYRLSISHLFVVTTWIAIVFAFANYLGGLGFVIAAVVWLGLQALMLGSILLWQRSRNGRRKNLGNVTEVRGNEPPAKHPLDP